MDSSNVAAVRNTRDKHGMAMLLRKNVLVAYAEAIFLGADQSFPRREPAMPHCLQDYA
jgi:hypothetical protein